MRTQFFAFAVTANAVFGAFNSSARTADKSKPKLHTWSSIQYGSLACPWATGHATASLHVADDADNNHAEWIESELRGLQFRLTFYRSDWSRFINTKTGKPLKVPEFRSPDSKKIIVRIHLRDGTVEKPLKWKLRPNAPEEAKLTAKLRNFMDDTVEWISRGPGGSIGTLARSFPSGKNNLDEAWIEVRFPGYVHWLEIPYGLVRNPKDKLCPPSKLGRPRYARAINKLEKNARIVNWKSVTFDIGKIQNGWRLTLIHANPGDAKSELVLYRDDSKPGKSSYLWKLHTPRTSISITESTGSLIDSLAMGIRLHQGGMRRSDTFNFSRGPASKERRWGTATITVGDKKYYAVMPSSLFRFMHGNAERRPR